MNDRQFPIEFPRDIAVLDHPNWLVAETPAWIEHIPFALWITIALRPRAFVELGTHYGNSYFAFAQALERSDVACSAYAVDTWAGDDHSGHYGEDVFESVSGYNSERFSTFSQLIRSTFDEAVGHFDDGEVDLLHIDGHHSYEAVRHDYESWLPRMSERGVILFHDIAVRERGFGVYRLWGEISRGRPSFAFTHGHGLGVLGVGSDIPEMVASLLRIDQESYEAAAVRRLFSALGGRISTDARAEERLAAVRVEAEDLLATGEAEAEERLAAVRVEAEERLVASRVEAEERLTVAREEWAEEAERDRVSSERLLDASRLETELADGRAALAFDERLSEVVSGTNGAEPS